MILSGIKTIIENDYPHNISEVYHKVRITKQEDLGSQHKNLMDLFEALIKMLCIMQLNDASNGISSLVDMLPQKEKAFEFLKRPGLGSWIELLRTLSNLKCDVPDLYWFTMISQWYNTTNSPEAKVILKKFQDIENLRFDAGSRTPIAEICNALVAYRNKQLAHAANFSASELKKRVDILAEAISFLLESVHFLTDSTMVYIDRAEIRPNDTWKYHTTKLRGITEEPFVFDYQDRLELNELYMIAYDKQGEISFALSLSPFLIYTVNPGATEPEIFYYNDAWKTKLEYLSYSTGAYYFHTELHEKFNKFIRIKLVPGQDEDKYRFLTSEERIVNAENLYKHALLFKQEELYEDAWMALEDAIEFDRKAKYLYELAEIMFLLDEDTERVLHTLNLCLDLDPDYNQAYELIKRVKSNEDNAIDKHFEMENLSILTIFDILVPTAFRRYATLFMLFLATIYYIPSISIEAIHGNTRWVIISLAQYVLLSTALIALHFIKKFYVNIRLPMSLQLKNMRLDRFNLWYLSQIEYIFGKYSYLSSFKDVRENYKNNLTFINGSILFIIFISVLGISITKIYQLDFGFFLIRYLDNIIALSIAYFFIIYIYKSTRFVVGYSKLSLSPMITNSSFFGFRALAKFQNLHVVTIVIMYSLLCIFGSLEVSIPYKFDYLLFLFALVLVCVWTIGLPYALRNAANNAKIEIINEYNNHVKKSLDTFVKNPQDDTLLRYRWLLNNVKEIKRIPVWPLSFVETVVFIVLANVIVLASYVLYIYFREGIMINRILEYLSQYI